MPKPRCWIPCIAALSSGLLTAALFPPFDLTFLVWIAVLPLLHALWNLRGKRTGLKGFGLGFLAGAAAFAIQLSWLAVVSPLGAVVLPLYLGLFWGAFGLFAATLGNPSRSKAGPLLLAFSHGAVWAGLEWLRGWLFTGFGWNGLGVAFHETRLFAQSADLLGVAGLSLVAVFVQSAVLQCLRNPDDRRRRVRTLAATASFLAILLAYGGWRISSEGRHDSTPLKTLLIQVNIPQDAARYLWDPLEIHLAYENDTAAALASLPPDQWPDWVIWPESALTGRILRTDDGTWGTWRENLDTIAAVRASGPFTLIHGANELEAVAEGGQLLRKPGGRAYNSLVVMSPDDELRTFRKHHLVIFGETIPFVESIPFLKKIYAQQAGVEYGGSFTPGGSFDPLPAATATGRPVGIIPSICFEDTVPRLKRRFLRPGPQVIVNITNDGWFKESPAAAQHFANARFRAIELRRPMIRCANTGVTAAIDTTGSTRHPRSGNDQLLLDSHGSHFTRGHLLTELDIPGNPARTLYGLIGDSGVILTSLLGLALTLKSRQIPGR